MHQEPWKAPSNMAIFLQFQKPIYNIHVSINGYVFIDKYIYIYSIYLDIFVYTYEQVYGDSRNLGIPSPISQPARWCAPFDWALEAGRRQHLFWEVKKTTVHFWKVKRVEIHHGCFFFLNFFVLKLSCCWVLSSQNGMNQSFWCPLIL